MIYFTTLLFCFAGFALLGIFALLTKGKYRRLVKIIALALGISAIILSGLADAHGEYAHIGNYVADIIVPRIQYIASTPIGSKIFSAIFYVNENPFMQTILVSVIFIILVLASLMSKNK